MEYEDVLSKEKLSEQYEEFAKSTLGSKLLELLSANLGDGKWKITIKFDSSVMGFLDSNINSKQLNISIGTPYYWPGAWAEELFHAFQETNVPHRYTENGKSICLNGNAEIESHMMQILHDKYGGFGCSGDNGRWEPYGDFINDPTEENFNKVVEAMSGDGYDKDRFQYDHSRFHIENFDKLKGALPPLPKE